MADAELGIIARMRDEASAALAKLGSQAGSSLGNLDKQARESAKGVSILGGALDTLGKVGLAAMGAKAIVEGIANTVSGLIGDAVEAEKIAAATDAVIASTKGVAGMSADAVAGLAGSLSLVIPVEDEVIQGAENMLLTFTRIGKDVFPQATETVLDMSIALGQDATQSALMLGKALNDPIAGVGALRRVGVQLTDAQEEQVKAFMAVNDVASAQKVILGELQTEFGGAARAAGQTFAGQLTILATQMGNVKETLGGALLEPLRMGITSLNEYLASDTVQEGIKSFAAHISDFIAGWAPQVQAGLELAGQGVSWLVGAFSSGFSAIFDIVNSVGQAIYEALSWLNPFATHSPSLVSQVEDGVAAIVESYEDTRAIESPLSYAAGAVQDFAGQSKDAIKGMVDDTRDSLDSMKDALAAAKDELRSWSQTPLKGSREYENKMFDLETQMTRLQIDQNRARAAGNKEQEKSLSGQIAALRAQQEELRLQERLTLGVQKKQLQDLAKYGVGGGGSAERSYEEIAQGILKSKSAVDQLEPAVKRQEAVLKAQQKAMAEVTKAAGAAGGAAKALGGAVAGATGPLQGITEAVAEGKRQVAEWQGRVASARSEIERFIKPATDFWRALFGGMETVEASGGRTLQRYVGGMFANLAGEFARGGLPGVGNAIYRWLADEIAKIDWGQVWQNVRNIGSGIGEGAWNIISDLGIWLGDQVAGLDWTGIWNAAKDVGGWIAIAGWDIISAVGLWLGRQIAAVDWPGVWNAVQSIGAWIGTTGWGIVSDVATWLGKQWALIDWGTVWAKVTSIGAAVGTSLNAIYTNVEQWLGNQWALIDWANIWKEVQGMGAAISENVASISGDLTTWMGTQFAAIDWNAVVNKAEGLDTEWAAWITKNFDSEATQEAVNASAKASGKAFGTALIGVLTNPGAWIAGAGEGLSANALIEKVLPSKTAQALVKTFFDTGLNSISGYYEGADEGIQNALGYTGNWINEDIVKPAQDALEAHSPSQVFFRLGHDTVTGLLNGIAALLPSVLASALSLGQTLKQGILDGMDGLAAAVQEIIRAATTNLTTSNGTPIQGYAAGGTVPGAVGQPMLAVVHGGETITPPGQGAGGFTFSGTIIIQGNGTRESVRDGVLAAARAMGAA